MEAINTQTNTYGRSNDDIGGNKVETGIGSLVGDVILYRTGFKSGDI